MKPSGKLAIRNSVSDLPLIGRKRNATLQQTEGKNVLEFFAAGLEKTAFLFRTVKGGGSCQCVEKNGTDVDKLSAHSIKENWIKYF